jgi:hypothetical protein
MRAWRFLAGNSKVAPAAFVVALGGSIVLQREGFASAAIFFAAVIGIGFVASLFETA